MSPRDDALREMAANRGCKLVKSRRRKPGGDFGRYGLKDAKSGRQVFGFGADGLTAAPEEIESFLRAGGLETWKTSLGAAASKPGAKARRAPPPPPPPAPRKTDRAPQPDPEPEPEPEPEPPTVREARPRDAAAISSLLGELGFPAGEKEVAARLRRLAKAGETPLVATEEERLVGCLGWHVMDVLHRDGPVGRVNLLVVTRNARRRGLGRILLQAAEARFAELGCVLVEATSNVDLDGAHAFYRRLGYERTSYRFAKKLD